MPRLVVIFVLCCATTAQAGIGVEGSIGSGYQIDAPKGRIPTNLLIAPGWSFFSDTVRFQLGILAELPDVKNLDFDIGFRPMLVVSPPAFPLYARLSAAVVRLVEDASFSLGAAAGVRFGVANIHLFGEVGYLPIVTNGYRSVIEGRLGAGFGF